jgi:hypothetical protein
MISNCPNPFTARDGAKLDFGPGYSGFFTVDLTSLSGSTRHRIYQGVVSSGSRHVIARGIISGDSTLPPLGTRLIALSIGPDSLHTNVSALDVVTLQRPRNHDVP